MATGYFRIKIESAPNNETGANAISATSFDLPYTEAFIDPKPSLANLDDEVNGFGGSAPAQNVAEYKPEGSVKVKCRPTYFGALLQVALGVCTNTPGNGTLTDPDSVIFPTGTHKHVYGYPTGAIPKTMQCEFSPPMSGTPHWKAKGCGIESLGFAFEDGVLVNTAALKALFCDTQTDPAYTPVVPTLKPFVGGSMTLTWLTGSATTEDFSFELQNSLDLFRGFTTTSKYPDQIEYANEFPSYRIVGEIPKRALDPEDWAALKAATTFSAKIKLNHEENITGSYKYQFWVEIPKCQYTDWSPEAMKNTRQQKASYNWEAKWDTATSKIATVTLIDGTTAFYT